MSGAAHLEQVARLRELAGKAAPVHRRLQGIREGAVRLETATRSWPAFAPRPAAVDEALNLVEGLRRELLDLRAELARTP